MGAHESEWQSAIINGRARESLTAHGSRWERINAEIESALENSCKLFDCRGLEDKNCYKHSLAIKA